MYLLYADESGLDRGDHFVVGGLAVHEQDAYLLARAVDSLVEELPVAWRSAELHAQNIRAGKNRWRRMTRARQQQLTESVAGLLVGNALNQRRPPVLFSVVHHKASSPAISPYERAYEEYFARCNRMLDRLASQGERHNCVVIADDSRLEESLQSAMLGWRERGPSTGAAIGPLSAYAEVPLFVDSKASRLVQLADFVAHWVYRAYEAGDDSVLQALAPGFDQEGDVVHGLVHLVRDYQTCACLACTSRRDAS